MELRTAPVEMVKADTNLPKNISLRMLKRAKSRRESPRLTKVRERGTRNGAGSNKTHQETDQSWSRQLKGTRQVKG